MPLNKEREFSSSLIHTQYNNKKRRDTKKSRKTTLSRLGIPTATRVLSPVLAIGFFIHCEHKSQRIENIELKKNRNS